MKFLHTADWHIGKVLHKQDLHEDISLFFDWLEQYIISEHIDVLLVSGDIFDLANPANRDTTLYYNFLRRLSLTGVYTIITGGNHDSISLLNAPSALLQALNITVIGGVPDDFEKQLIPIYSKDEQLCAVVVAVPFLRDRDLRLSVSADLSLDKSKIIPIAIKQHYDSLVSKARELYGDVPLIGMGHLFMQGSMISDSERDIHVGNLAGLERKMISDAIAYMALGHIHKPQRIDKLDHIRYSGSPIYLDFSESGYEKIVVVVNVDNNNTLDIKSVRLPKFRNLIRTSGTVDEVKSYIDSYSDDLPLPAFAEVEITEDTLRPTMINDIQEIESNKNEKCIVIKTKVTYKDKTTTHHGYDQHLTIANLNPHQIFDIRLDGEMIDDVQKEDLKIVYHHILESFTD